MNQKLKELQAQLLQIANELQAIENNQTEAPKEEGFKLWAPKDDGPYFYLDEVGDPFHHTYTHHQQDDLLIGNHNVYPTKEKAQQEAEYLKTLRELRAWSDGLDGRWVIYRENGRHISAYIQDSGLRTPHVRFKTEQRAEAAIKHFGNRLDVIYK